MFLGVKEALRRNFHHFDTFTSLPPERICPIFFTNGESIALRPKKIYLEILKSLGTVPGNLLYKI